MAKHRILIISILLIVINLIVATNESNARKCAAWRCHISGKVIDGLTNKPIERALVEVYIDKAKIPVSKYYRKENYEDISTSLNGYYEGVFFISSYNDYIILFTCDKIPKQYEIEVKKDGYKTIRTSGNILKQQPNQSEKYDFIISAPIITLQPL